MKLLWSRASQSHSCHCQSCNSALFRTAAATGRPHVTRRKPTFAEIFTACYSSIFAVSAVIDSKVKDARRIELEHQLEQTRAELSALREERKRLERKDYILRQEGKNHPKNVFAALYTIINDSGAIFDRTPIDNPYANISDLQLGIELPHLSREALRQRATTDYHLLECAVAGEKQEARHEHRHHVQRRQTLSHFLAKHESDVAECIDCMLHCVTLGAYKNNGSPEVSPEHLSPSFRKLWEARSEGYPFYDGKWANTRMHPSHFIQASHNSKGPLHHDYVFRACYNLMTLPAEPEIHILNSVVVSMDRLGLHQVTKVLIGRFFHAWLVRPTRYTVVAFLNHYKATNAPLQFYSIIAHIIGQCDEGFKIFRKDVEKVRLLPPEELSRLGIQYSLTRFGHHILAQVSLNKPILNMLLQGLLHFELIEQAAMVLLAAFDDWFHLAAHNIALLIDHCIALANWKLAIYLVRGLAHQGHRVAQILLISERADGLLGRLENLLAMCGMPASLERAKDVPLEQFDMDPKGFYTMCLAMRVKRLDQDLESHSLAEIYDGQWRPEFLTRAPGESEWTADATHRLRIFGLEKQVESVKATVLAIELRILALTSGKRHAATRRGNKSLRLDMVGNQVTESQSQTRRIHAAVRKARILSIANHIDNMERDFVPLQQRLYAVCGIAALRRLQEAETYHVKLETELLRVHRTATSMRLRLAQVECFNIRHEALLILKQLRPRKARSKLRKQENVEVGRLEHIMPWLQARGAEAGRVAAERMLAMTAGMMDEQLQVP